MIALLAACTQGSGCAAGTGASKDKHPAKDKPTTQPVMPVAQGQTYTAPVVVDKPVPPKPVRTDKAPIVYLLPAGGSLRVVDKTAGMDLAVTQAEARSILRVDDLTGVTLGQKTLLKGPLTPGHEYEVYLTTGAENVIQRGTFSPGR